MKLSLDRSLTSYAKVQHWVGNWIRNREFQLRRNGIALREYLDIGCGRNVHAGFINVDYLWHPGVDVCWDITQGLPFPDGSMKGVFTEHCLEHFDLAIAYRILKECSRVLAPGGRLRIVVPDGGMYLQRYHERLTGKSSVRFPFEDRESFDGLYAPILSVNRIFYQDRNSIFGHRCMYDLALLKLLLSRLGFQTVEQAAFRQGRDPMLLIDTESRQCESLYVEGVLA